MTEKQREIQRKAEIKKKRIDNLQMWGKGVSGNPVGRPKKENCIPDILRNIGDEKAPDGILKSIRKVFPDVRSDIKFKEAIMRVNMINALKGDKDAIKFFAERTEGKVPIKSIVQNIDVIDKVIETIWSVFSNYIPLEDAGYDVISNDLMNGIIEGLNNLAEE